MNKGMIVLCAAGALMLASAAGAGELEPGFNSIFNGTSLAGWIGDPRLWSVKGGAITGQTTTNTPAKGNTFLIWTNGVVDDFELRCSFKLVPGDEKKFANSGIQYRSQVLDPANWVVGGYQADMEAGPTYTGILYEERMSRGIMAARGEKVVWDKDCKKQVTGSLGKSEELQAAIKQGDWNDYAIIAQGNHLQHFVNGRQTVDVTDDCESKRAMSGVLALQLHAGSPMMAQFRDLRIKPLSAEKGGDSDPLAPLQGAWRVQEIEAEGSALPPDDITNIVVKIKGSAFTVENNDNIDHGTFTIDPARKPMQMDIQSESAANGPRTMAAIYEVGPERLRVCYARQGASRPATFSTADDKRLLMITYTRIKP